MTHTYTTRSCSLDKLTKPIEGVAKAAQEKLEQFNVMGIPADRDELQYEIPTDSILQQCKSFSTPPPFDLAHRPNMVDYHNENEDETRSLTPAQGENHGFLTPTHSKELNDEEADMEKSFSDLRVMCWAQTKPLLQVCMAQGSIYTSLTRAMAAKQAEWMDRPI